MHVAQNSYKLQRANEECASDKSITMIKQQQRQQQQQQHLQCIQTDNLTDAISTDLYLCCGAASVSTAATVSESAQRPYRC